MQVGIIGLGSMGGRIAGRLLQQGCQLGVYDTNPDQVDGLVAQGATAFNSISALGQAHDLVLTVLPDAAVVRQVVLGDDGLLNALEPGSVLVDMTSSVAAVTKELGAMLGE